MTRNGHLGLAVLLLAFGLLTLVGTAFGLYGGNLTATILRLSIAAVGIGFGVQQAVKARRMPRTEAAA
jgi:hypothetical protein